MKKIILVTAVSVLSMLFCGFVYGQGASLGSISQATLGPLHFLRYMFNAASVLVGVFMVMTSVARFMRYRQNPQETSLSYVIVLFILGLSLAIAPLLYDLSTAASIHTGASDTVFN